MGKLAENSAVSDGPSETSDGPSDFSDSPSEVGRSRTNVPQEVSGGICRILRVNKPQNLRQRLWQHRSWLTSKIGATETARPMRQSTMRWHHRGR